MISTIKKYIQAFYDWAGLSELVNYSWVMKHLFFLFFLVGIALFHIYNSHKAEKRVREISKLEKKVKELKWEYTTIMSDYMQKSKQSQLAIELEKKGLKESTTPPQKIVISSREY